jgi:hypothetical protein
MSEDPISVINRWDATLDEWVQANDEVPGDGDLRPVYSLFQRTVLPIFNGDKIATTVSDFEVKHPWILDFKDPARESFAEAIEQYQEDASQMPDVLSAYVRLLSIARAKKQLECLLQADQIPNFGFLTSYDSSKLPPHDDEDEKPKDLFIATHAQFCDLMLNRWAAFSRLMSGSRWDRWLHVWDSQAVMSEWRRVVEKIWEFGNHVSPDGEKPSLKDFERGIDNLRSKIIRLALRPKSTEGWQAKERELHRRIQELETMNSEKERARLETIERMAKSWQAKENELNGKIEQLERQNSKSEETIREYSKIICDLNFRRLLETLPIAHKAAKAAQPAQPAPQPTQANQGTTKQGKNKGGKAKAKNQQPGTAPAAATATPPQTTIQYGPEWQSFWSQAWRDAEHGAHDELAALWDEAKIPAARDNIKKEGELLYGQISGNIHNYRTLKDKNGKAKDGFDIKQFHLDWAREGILKALKPVNFKDGDVDWDAEANRFSLV